MSRFFVPPECIKGNTALIEGEEAHHILDVMRLKGGDRVQFFDGRGRLYQGKIFATGTRKLKLKIECVYKDLLLSNLEITLIQALPKKNKMDYIVEKSTELGVDIICPVQTARTIVKLDKARQLSRKNRWQRLTREAAKQCGRRRIPQVKDIAPWSEVLFSLNTFDWKLIACLSGKTLNLRDVLRAPLEPRRRVSLGRGKSRRIAFLIGPEGDFTPDEVRQAEDAGCIAVSLGTNVLKSDTAAIATLAMINYELRQ